MSDLDIAPLWQTTFWLGTFNLDDDAVTLAAALDGDEPQDITGLRSSVRLMSEAEQAAAAVGSRGDGPLFWTHRIQRWAPGFQLGLSYQRAAVWALAVLDSALPDDHPLSGEIRLHDPRAGAGNVGVPGLPWGRPVAFPAAAGALVAIPGWLPYSIAPVRPGHTVTAWTVFGYHAPPVS